MFPGGLDPASPPNGGSDLQSRVFPYRYAFEVPAAITSPTLTITVPPGPAVAAFSGDTPITVNPGTATIPIAFPAAAAFVAPPGAASSPLHLATPTVADGTSGRQAAPAPSTSTTGSVFNATNIEIALAAVVAAALIALRVRHRNPTPASRQASPDPVRSDIPTQTPPRYPHQADFYYPPPPGRQPGRPDEPGEPAGAACDVLPDADIAAEPDDPANPDGYIGAASDASDIPETRKPSRQLDWGSDGGSHGGLEEYDDVSGSRDPGPFDPIGPTGVSTRLVLLGFPWVGNLRNRLIAL